MKVAQPHSTWLFVVHTPLHLAELKGGDESWWCVDRRCQPGDKAFVYRPLKGVSCMFEILALTAPEAFCSGYAMATARIKVLRVFDPPISAKQLKSSSAVRMEGFVRKNFQGKSFILHSEKAPKAILALGA